MQRTPVIRKYSTTAQREEILAHYQRSGLTQRDFARSAGISLSTLQRWLWKTPKPKLATKPPTFIPVANLLAQNSGPACYRLRLTDGMVIEVPGGFCASELRELLQAVQAL